MTEAEFNRLLDRIPALSTAQMRRLREELDSRLAATVAGSAASELQRRLLEAGILSEVKPPISNVTPYRDRRAVPVLGEPVSETILRERR